jgi:hypothetical protein
MTKKELAYVDKLESAVKKIPNIYYRGAMDKGWGLNEDELDVKQEQFQKKVDNLLKKRKASLNGL